MKKQKPLKPCPFCGQTVMTDILEVRNPITFYDGRIRGDKHKCIICWGCGANIHGIDSKEVISKWNKRSFAVDKESEEE